MHNVINKCAEVIFMSKNKKKIRKLTDEQYNEYIAVLRKDAALYNADGEMFVPPSIERPQNGKKQGE